MKTTSSVTRCSWRGIENPHYQQYHDTEWGVPVHDDQRLFEMLILEGAQAGLSWETVLKRRQGYRDAFLEFDIYNVAAMSDQQLEALLTDENIIRNRLKIFSVRKNARVVLDIQKEYGSFDIYVWRFAPISSHISRPKSLTDIPARTPESDALSKDLKKRGMSFVGTTIMYAYMQAIGMVDDHIIDCFRAKSS